MRIVTWTIRLLVFVLLVAFGAKNVEPVTLRFYFGVEVATPLILALFGAFALGAFFGVLSLLGRVLRQRREISALKKRSTELEAVRPAATPAASQPDLPPWVPPL
jgi:lipopolysaccharide assembly protein A